LDARRWICRIWRLRGARERCQQSQQFRTDDERGAGGTPDGAVGAMLERISDPRSSEAVMMMRGGEGTAMDQASVLSSYTEF
jgi:hypothetical protein